MLCDGQFVGFIFITDNNPNVPGKGSSTTGDIDLTGRRHIIDVFPLTMTDEQIQNDLIIRTEVRGNCRTFTITPNE